MQDLQKETKSDEVGLHGRSSQQPQIHGASTHGPRGRAGGTKALQDRRVVGDRATVLSEGLKLQ